RNGTERICCATCELCLGRVPTDRPTRRCYRRQRQPARSLPSTLDPRHWSAVASSSVAPPVRHHSIRSRRHAERPSPTLTRADELTTHDTRRNPPPPPPPAAARRCSSWWGSAESRRYRSRR